MLRCQLINGIPKVTVFEHGLNGTPHDHVISLLIIPPGGGVTGNFAKKPAVARALKFLCSLRGFGDSLRQLAVASGL